MYAIKSTTIKLRPYQEPIMNNMMECCMYALQTSKRAKDYILAVAPGGGKTVMALNLIKEVLRIDPSKKILVLTHSTTVLRENFLDTLKKYMDVDMVSSNHPGFSVNHARPIHVYLPHSEAKLLNANDIIIVDEAHQNFLADRVQRIIAATSPKFVLGMTGTPSNFIYENALNKGANNYLIDVLGMDRIGMKYFHELDFRLIESDYDFNIGDFNAEFDLKDVEFDEEKIKQTAGTVKNVVLGIVKKVISDRLQNISEDEIIGYAQEYFNNRSNHSKTIFMCKRIEQARQVSLVLSAMGIKNCMSTSDDDKKSKVMSKFKAGRAENVLVVVARAREGYSDDYVTNLVDLTLSHNINIIYQMFCRTVRKLSGYDDNKLFIKVTPNTSNFPEYTASVMCAALMLSHTDYLSKYNGRNFDEMPVPEVLLDRSGDGEITVRFDTGNNINKKNVLQGDVLNLMIDVSENLFNGQSVYKATSIMDVLNKLKGIVELMSPDEVLALCVKEKLATCVLYQKFRNDNENYNIPSDPWSRAGMSSRQYFKEVRTALDMVDKVLMSPEDVFVLCVKNSITKPILYRRFRSDNEDLNFPAKPWVRVGKTEKDYFIEVKEALGIVAKLMPVSLDETRQLCVENKLITINKLRGYRKNNPDKKIPSDPWRIESITASEYFNNIKKIIGIDDKLLSSDVVRKLCIDEKLISIGKWRTYRKNNPSKKIHSDPWLRDGVTQREYFHSIKKELDLICSMTIEGIIALCIDEKLISIRKFMKYRKDNLDKKLPSRPWTLFEDKTQSDFFLMIRQGLGIKEYILMPQNDVVELCVKEKLTSLTKYMGFKNNNQNLNLPIKPGSRSNILDSVFFKIIRDKISNEIK